MNIASLPMLASCSILLLTLLCSDAGVPQRVDLQQEADALQAYVALSEQQTYVGKAAGNVDKDFEEEENEPETDLVTYLEQMSKRLGELKKRMLEEERSSEARHKEWKDKIEQWKERIRKEEENKQLQPEGVQFADMGAFLDETIYTKMSAEEKERLEAGGKKFLEKVAQWKKNKIEQEKAGKEDKKPEQQLDNKKQLLVKEKEKVAKQLSAGQLKSEKGYKAEKVFLGILKQQDPEMKKTEG